MSVVEGLGLFLVDCGVFVRVVPQFFELLELEKSFFACFVQCEVELFDGLVSLML